MMRMAIGGRQLKNGPNLRRRWCVVLIAEIVRIAQIATDAISARLWLIVLSV
jgi:hypothetical protein